MKIRNGKGKYAQRTAISPIIATVLIIAVTLIAAVAIGGFVFGIFGSSSSSAEVSVTVEALTAAGFQSGGTAAAASCSVTAAANALELSNTGTAATSATGVTITWAGVTTSFAITAPCTVTAAGDTGATTAGNPIYVLFGATNKLPTSGVSGQTYTGTVTMANGAVVLFTGAFI